mmetsp:Transcript_70379/g.131661  ORF Transcript_70379/g.131661 Transcript_70379/m.131661 type:complete len:669 (+) Transcript_70379:84-2090(+)
MVRSPCTPARGMASSKLRSRHRLVLLALLAAAHRFNITSTFCTLVSSLPELSVAALKRTGEIAATRLRPQLAASADDPAPIMTVALKCLDLGEKAVGAGVDLVDIQLLTKTGEPLAGTFMLDSGLTSNLVTKEFAKRAGLPPSKEKVTGSGLGGEQVVENTLLPGLEIMGEEREEEADREIFSGVWAGDGWRALCTLDWDAWVAASKKGADVKDLKVRYKVLPTDSVKERQLDTFIGVEGTEFVEGSLKPDGPDGAFRFVGRGTAVEPPKFLAKTEKYEFVAEGNDELVEVVSGMKLRRKKASRKGLPLPSPMMAAEVDFPQVKLAEMVGIDLVGMLGQWPLHQVSLLHVDRAAQELKIYKNSDTAAVVAREGMVRVPGVELPSGLFGVEIFHHPLVVGPGWGDGAPVTVQAMVDTGASYSIVNWAAAEMLFGLKEDDKAVQEAIKVRARGIGGRELLWPLMRLNLGVATTAGKGDTGVQFRTVDVAIGDAPSFDQLFGREEEGMFGSAAAYLGLSKPKPGALIGQDLLSQQPYMLAAVEPAIYVSTKPTEVGKMSSFKYIGEGDCVNADGQRLQGLQKVACTPDDAADACLALPPGSCHGIAVTPSGKFQGLCYIFVEDSEPDAIQEKLAKQGFRRYEAPAGQTLAAAGARVAEADGQPEAQCFAYA